jgi:hypothetical protein
MRHFTSLACAWCHVEVIIYSMTPYYNTMQVLLFLYVIKF